MIKHSIVIILLCLQSLTAQRLSHPLHADPPQRTFRTAAGPDTLKVLAVMVQFQTDNDSRTSGNGQFDLSSTNERIIDAAPHDSAYFADHFTFAQDYFSKVSNGRQHIAATVLGRTITLKKAMKEYAPVSSNLPLASMIDEVWKAVDSLYPGFPFERYGLFAVFHAGVGRDIDLRAAIGYDPTPLDLPSLYFSLNAFKGLFGPSFTGITLKNSSAKITNSVVLPETEVRRIASVGGDVVLKLGINGLLAASIGSHLGLPDLFDTKSGKSAIGRFGLMDGQSIFSYYGAAPPEPSAWEKTYLGWTTPITVSGTQTLSAPAVGLYNAYGTMDTIYKVPISAKEYFLLENRNRDAKLDGQTVTMRWKGQIVTRTFTRDEEYFASYNIDSLYGTVLGTDEPDWSLPGLINDKNAYSGGMLIWHIDEGVIERSLATNSVNADPERKGVDLEEADGSQDIGQSYSLTNPASGSEDGSPIDYWFSGNIFPKYTNQFSETTLPNSLSNTGARSHVTIKDFSAKGTRMTFQVLAGSADIRLAKLVKRKNVKSGNNDAPIAADLNGDGKEELIFTSGDSVYAFKDDLTPFLVNTTGLLSPFGGKFQPLFAQNIYATLTASNGIVNSLVGANDSIIFFFSDKDANADGLLDTIVTVNTHRVISTHLLSTTDGLVHFGTVDGKRGVAGVLSDGRGYVSIINASASPAVTVSQGLSGLTTSPFIVSTTAIGPLTFATDDIRAAVFGLSKPPSAADAVPFIAATFGSGTLAIVNAKTQQPQLVPLPGISRGLALANVDGDNTLDILVGAGPKLFAYNIKGNIIDHFPFSSLDRGSFTGSPVIAAQKNASSVAIIAGTTNGHLYAFNEQGNILAGFPLQTGGMVSSPVLWGKYLVAASTDSSLYIWELNQQFDTSKVYWGNFAANNCHTSFTNIVNIGAVKSAELLPKKFAYNWPNPVYSGSTFIRYFLGKEATVSITIVNMAGELVQELKGTGYSGIDNEVAWDITKVQSGIYFAQITASGGGEEVSQIVKIAVVK